MSDPRHGRGCDCRRCQNRRTRQRTYAATRQHLRYSPPHINPTNIRTYGEPWDSIIAAGALAACPPSGLPRANDRVSPLWSDGGADTVAAASAPEEDLLRRSTP